MIMKSETGHPCQLARVVPFLLTLKEEHHVVHIGDEGFND
jgi:hypothetical protein